MPENFTLKPSTDDDWAISRALPLAIPLATSKRTRDGGAEIVKVLEKASGI